TAGEFERLQRVWRDQLADMLVAMTTAWEWRERRAVPTLARYVDNADCRGSSFVDLSHWIYVADDWSKAHLDDLRAASRQVQRYLHLLGDVVSYRRDMSWGDLNVLALGVERTEVTDAMTELAGEACELIERLRPHSPRTASYLRRQIGFSAGYTGVSGFRRVP
ncbi:terpene synthase family protein, partial [Nonomuraea fuscirosea]